MRIMGRRRALAAVVAGTFLLAGCGSGPSQVGAAAFVGDTVIPLDKVQELIGKAVREQPYARKLAAEHKLDTLGKVIVSQLITDELVAQAARQEGAVADQAQVAQAVAKSAALPPVPENADASTALVEVVARVVDAREEFTNLNLEQQLAKKMAAKLEVTFDYVLITPRTDQSGQTEPPQQVQSNAVSVARQYAADPAGVHATVLESVKQAKAANKQSSVEADVKGTLGDAAGFESTPLFWTPENNVVVFAQPSEQGGYYVMAIRKRSTAGITSTAQQQPLSADQALSIGAKVTQEYARKTTVKVNPRYGMWDVVSMSVAKAPTTDNSSLVVPFGTPPAQQ